MFSAAGGNLHWPLLISQETTQMTNNAQITKTIPATAKCQLLPQSCTENESHLPARQSKLGKHCLLFVQESYLTRRKSHTLKRVQYNAKSHSSSALQPNVSQFCIPGRQEMFSVCATVIQKEQTGGKAVDYQCEAAVQAFAS